VRRYDEVLCRILPGTGKNLIAPFSGLSTGWRPCPRDCVFGGWSEWSRCGARCGQSSTQSRHRVEQEPAKPSAYFPGSTSEICPREPLADGMANPVYSYSWANLGRFRILH
jgi:hypothetical protein